MEEQKKMLVIPGNKRTSIELENSDFSDSLSKLDTRENSRVELIMSLSCISPEKKFLNNGQP